MKESLRKGRGAMNVIFQRSRAGYDTDVIAQGEKGVNGKGEAMRCDAVISRFKLFRYQRSPRGEERGTRNKEPLLLEIDINKGLEEEALFCIATESHIKPLIMRVIDEGSVLKIWRRSCTLLLY
jgi:hypothetical protein